MVVLRMQPSPRFDLLDQGFGQLGVQFSGVGRVGLCTYHNLHPYTA